MEVSHGELCYYSGNKKSDFLREIRGCFPLEQHSEYHAQSVSDRDRPHRRSELDSRPQLLRFILTIFEVFVSVFSALAYMAEFQKSSECKGPMPPRPRPDRNTQFNLQDS